MSQSFSVQIYSTSFKLTVKNKHLDEGYFSSSESEMEKKQECEQVGQGCEHDQHVEAARGELVQAGHGACHTDHLCPGQAGQSGHLPQVHAKVKKKKDIDVKKKPQRAPPFSGPALHSSDADGGRLARKINIPPPATATTAAAAVATRKMHSRGRSVPAARNTALGSKIYSSKQLPPPTNTSQQKSAAARPRSSSSPPANISNLEMYQIKLQNYMFCPEMRDLNQCGSFSTDGVDGSSGEENFEDAGGNEDEAGYEDEDEIGHEEETIRRTQTSALPKSSASSLDCLAQGDVPAAGKEEDAGEGDENSQSGGQQADQLHQQRAGPARGRGQAEQGAGVQLDDNVLDPGRRAAKSSFQPEQGNRRLIIKINPARWGFHDPAEHSSPASVKAFKNYYYDLFHEVAQYEGFDWTTDDCQQSFACAVVRLAKKGEPGAIHSGDFDDYFEYDHSGLLVRSNISLDLTLGLNGVDQDDPTNFFPPVSHCSSDQQLDCALRQGQVLLYQMVADLKSKNIEVEVEYTHSQQANGDPIVTNYLDAFIKLNVFEAARDVRIYLHNIFQFQRISRLLARAIADLDEDVLDDLEQLVCDFVLGDGSNGDALKRRATMVMERLSQLKKTQRQYENQGLKLYGSSSLKAAFVRKEFENQNSLLGFLSNEATEQQNWIREPNKWCPGLARLRFGGVAMKITFSPSRLFISKEVLGYEALTSKVKDLIDRSMDAVRDAGAAAAGGRPPPPSPTHPGSGPSPSSPPAPSSPTYPAHIIVDAETFILQVQTLDFKTASQQILDQLHKSGVDISRELQQHLWRTGVSLKREDKKVQEDLKVVLMHLAKALKEKVDEQKLKEIEQRELSKAISSAKAPTLSASGREIQAFLEFHQNFKHANSLSRALKLKEGMAEELKERFVHEVDPEKILSVLRGMFLAQDVLLPLSRQNIVQLPNCPPVGTKQELKAYSEILGFVAKLEKADMLERMDFSTMALIVQKLSKQRIDNWDREWMEEQLKIDSEPLKFQEDRKRQMLVNFLRINESILHRRLLQSSITGQEKNQPKKEKRETILATAEVRSTRFDKRANKGSVKRGENFEAANGGHRRTSADIGGHRAADGGRQMILNIAVFYAINLAVIQRNSHQQEQTQVPGH